MCITWCPGPESNRYAPFGSIGFSYHYSFHYQIALFVVWTIPSPYLSILGARRLVSTRSISLFANGASLGINILQSSPNLTGSTSTVSSRALKFLQVRGVYQFHHPGNTLYYTDNFLSVNTFLSSFIFSTNLRFTMFFNPGSHFNATVINSFRTRLRRLKSTS